MCSVATLLAILLSSAVTTASSSSPSPTVCESVRALDESGANRQLRHAAAAADQRGRLVVLMAVHFRGRGSGGRGGELWAATLPPPPHLRRAPDVVHPVTSPADGSSRSSSVYAVFTGIQADAAWLLGRLRLYGRNVWEVTGSRGPRAVSAVGAQLVGSFWGFNGGDGEDGEDDDGGTRQNRLWNSHSARHSLPGETWARPLGVKAVLVTFLDEGRMRLELLEPSGIVQRLNRNFFAMGKNSAAIQREWERVQAERGDGEALVVDDDVEAERLLWKVVQATMTSPPEQLQVHTLSAARGIEMRTLSPQ
jgi:hypothetical protein